MHVARNHEDSHYETSTEIRSIYSYDKPNNISKIINIKFNCVSIVLSSCCVPKGDLCVCVCVCVCVSVLRQPAQCSHHTVVGGADKAVVIPTPHHHNVMLHCPRPQETLPDMELWTHTHTHTHTQLQLLRKSIQTADFFSLFLFQKSKHFQATWMRVQTHTHTHIPFRASCPVNILRTS